MQRPISFALILLFAGACTLLSKPQPPEVKLSEVRVDSVNLTGARLIFSIDAYNPNPDTLTVDSVKYDLELNHKGVAKGEVTKPTELKGKTRALVDIPVDVEFAKVFDSLTVALQMPKSEYRIFGTAKLGLFSVPFDEKGTFEWQKR